MPIRIPEPNPDQKVKSRYERHRERYKEVRQTVILSFNTERPDELKILEALLSDCCMEDLALATKIKVLLAKHYKVDYQKHTKLGKKRIRRKHHQLPDGFKIPKPTLKPADNNTNTGAGV